MSNCRFLFVSGEYGNGINGMPLSQSFSHCSVTNGERFKCVSEHLSFSEPMTTLRPPVVNYIEDVAAGSINFEVYFICS